MELGSSHLSHEPLPSYETMIVETLEALERPQGAPPRDIFNYMMNHWPLIPNFRPSATQALQRALKRGRLLKTNGLYYLNPTWISGHTTPDNTRPARHLAKRPASLFVPRAPQVNDTRRSDSNEPPSSGSGMIGISPYEKATAQAAAALLRSIAHPINEIANGPAIFAAETQIQTLSSVAQDWEVAALTEQTGSANIDRPLEAALTMPIRAPRRLGRPTTGISPRPKIPHSAIPPPVSFPIVDRHQEPLDERRIRKSLIASLETIVSQLRVLRNEQQTASEH